jgi:hypothetical protein
MLSKLEVVPKKQIKRPADWEGVLQSLVVDSRCSNRERVK